jgi:hypothetical protein
MGKLVVAKERRFFDAEPQHFINIDSECSFSRTVCSASAEEIS